MRKMRLRVVDAMQGPHGRRILRLRLQEGEALTVKTLKGARMKAITPDGDERSFTIDSFVLFGGKPSDERMARTGRADVAIVDEEGAADAPPIGLQWEVTPA